MDEYERKVGEFESALNLLTAEIFEILDQGLREQVETQIRCFELQTHEKIRNARLRYEAGIRNLPNLAEPLRETEHQRLKKDLDRSIDSLLDQLGNLKTKLYGIINS